MPTLVRKWNYRNISLTDPPENPETVGVYLKEGSIRQLPWRGFLTREQAIARNAIPVRLDIYAVIVSDAIGAPRTPLVAGEFIQGAVVNGLAFGVLDENQFPKIVSLNRIVTQ